MWSYQIWSTANFEWGWLSLVATVLLAATYSDLKSRIIPNKITLGGTLALILYLYFFSELVVLEHFFGFIISVFVFYTLYVLKIFGGGDSKLFMFIGLSLGAPYLLSVWLWIFIIGGFQAGCWNFFFKQKSIPYALSITLGTLLYLLTSRLYA